MDKLSFKQTVKQNLIKSAKAYSYLLNKKIIIKIPNTNRKYIFRFFERNYLHLTGVKTKYKSYIFYKKCYKKRIKLNDFYFINDFNKKIVRIKLRNLININIFFNKCVLIQENFEKGNIRCTIASSDMKSTIGFIKYKNINVPMTLLDKNHLNKNKPIYLISPIVLKIKK